MDISMFETNAFFVEELNWQLLAQMCSWTSFQRNTSDRTFTSAPYQLKQTTVKFNTTTSFKQTEDYSEITTRTPKKDIQFYIETSMQRPKAAFHVDKSEILFYTQQEDAAC